MYDGFDHRLFATEMAGIVKEFVAKEVAPLKARIAELEAKQINLVYRGTWKEGEQYQPNNFVTDNGSMWCCLRETSSRPTDYDGSWVMTVRAGRDAKTSKATA